MNHTPITIKPITDVEGCRHIQAVYRHTWASEDRDIAPTHILITIAKNGGIVLGAYTDDGPSDTGGMVGFVYGWLGAAPDPANPGGPLKIKHCSHTAGVVPEWQGRGIGARLKLAQRQTLLDQGVTDYATWTYDPLYWVNGTLNIRRLGAICTTYIRNIYGDMSDALNAGAPSDRCQVDWYLRSPRVERAIASPPAYPTWDMATMQILGAAPSGDFTRPTGEEPRFTGAPVALPLPDNIAAIRRADRDLLLEWRLYVRAVLEAAFAAGYALVDSLDLPGRGWHYILTPRPELVEGPLEEAN